MSEPNAPEPTMEEILASIRRIISEDEPAPAPAAPPAPEPEAFTPAAPAPAHEDVLELTEPVHEPAAAAPFETIGDLDIHSTPPEPAPAPAPVAAAPAPPPTPRAPPPAEEEPLIGDQAAESAASAFGHLAQHLFMPGSGRTLEDVVRELLKPLLKAWLDENLPGIVQAKVDEEVARIARRRV